MSRDSTMSTHIGAVKNKIMLNILKLTLVIRIVIKVIRQVVMMNAVSSVKSIYCYFFLASSLLFTGAISSSHSSY